MLTAHSDPALDSVYSFTIWIRFLKILQTGSWKRKTWISWNAGSSFLPEFPMSGNLKTKWILLFLIWPKQSNLFKNLNRMPEYRHPSHLFHAVSGDFQECRGILLFQHNLGLWSVKFFFFITISYFSFSSIHLLISSGKGAVTLISSPVTGWGKLNLYAWSACRFMSHSDGATGSSTLSIWLVT